VVEHEGGEHAIDGTIRIRKRVGKPAIELYSACFPLGLTLAAGERLFVAVGTGVLSSAVAFRFTDQVTTAAMARLPLVLIPAYFVPIFIMLHLVALFRTQGVMASAGGVSQMRFYASLWGDCEYFISAAHDRGDRSDRAQPGDSPNLPLNISVIDPFIHAVISASADSSARRPRHSPFSRRRPRR